MGGENRFVFPSWLFYWGGVEGYSIIFLVGAIDGGAIALGLLLYLWQMPHFHALSYNLREDYMRGGYKMLAVTNLPGLARNTLFHAAAMLPLGALFAYTGVTGKARV
jgi:heme O synthase-like polyprenyltransferase